VCGAVSFPRCDAVQTATVRNSRRFEGAFWLHREVSPGNVSAWATLRKEEASFSEILFTQALPKMKC